MRGVGRGGAKRGECLVSGSSGTEIFAMGSSPARLGVLAVDLDPLRASFRAVVILIIRQTGRLLCLPPETLFCGLGSSRWPRGRRGFERPAQCSDDGLDRALPEDA